MKILGVGGYIWLFLLLAACSQTPAPSETTVQILRTPPAVPTQAALATVPAPTSSDQPVAMTITSSATAVPTETAVITPTQTTIATPTPTPSPYAVIGTSVEDRPIVSYQFGDGDVPIIFVGGIHGGYEWNTILLAYEMIDYFSAYSEKIPENITLYIIPSANPDGQFLITGSNGRFLATDIFSDTETILGRFNANGVDLNRNWDCEWSPTAMWRDRFISGGDAPFSEPETSALRDYFLAVRPSLVLFWHSTANGVYAAGCSELHTPSYTLATLYGETSEYPVFPRFDAYPVTGDASDWLTTQNIPSISIELSSHQALDWEQNLAGVSTLLDYFGHN